NPKMSREIFRNLYCLACRKALALRHAALAQLTESCLGARFDQAELRLRQLHLAADLLGGLFLEVEADQHFAVALMQAVEHAECDRRAFLRNQPALRI